jgi:hypothetical protein
MSTSWTSLTSAEAAAHPLYGVKNWLVVFAFGVLLGLFSELGSLKGEAHKAGMSLSELLSIDLPEITLSKVALAFDTVAVLVIYWLLLTKHPKFRVVASWLLVGSYPVVVIIGLLNPFAGLGEVIVTSFFPWAITCAVWVTYLNRSRRVRVTFEHMVRTDESDTPLIVATNNFSRTEKTPFATVDVKDGIAPATSSANSPLSIASAQSNIGTAANDEAHWAQALSEFESQSRRPGLWAKSFSDASGNESLAKAAYLASRVVEIQREHLAALAKQEQMKRQEEKKAQSQVPLTTLYGVCTRCKSTINLRSSTCGNCNEPIRA